MLLVLSYFYRIFYRIFFYSYFKLQMHAIFATPKATLNELATGWNKLSTENIVFGCLAFHFNFPSLSLLLRSIFGRIHIRMITFDHSNDSVRLRIVDSRECVLCVCVCSVRFRFD